MRTTFTILLCCFSILIYSQTKRIENNIIKLDNNQFIIDHSVKAMFSCKSSPARKLIGIGKPATQKLIEALNDPNKIIMAHLVLCHIYFNHVSFAGPKEQTKGDEIIYKYYLGQEKGEGLIISEIKSGTNYKMYVEPKNVEEIIAYWKAKTKN